MILSRRVLLNGQYLGQQNAAIVVRSVEAGAPRSDAQMTPLMSGVGQRITSLSWSELVVTVRFAIDIPKRQLSARQQAYEAACAWALSGRGKWLSVGHMPGRRLYVDRVEISEPADLWEWTNEYTFMFHAVSVPFWQDQVPAHGMYEMTPPTGTEYTGDFAMYIPGQFRSVLDVSIRNDTLSELTSVTISTGVSTIILTGLSLPGNKLLIISHTDEGLLQITENGVDAYGKQASGGSTDLYVNPGAQTISITADRAIAIDLYCCGRYA